VIEHSRSTRIGVLVAQLGTPDAPTPQAVRPYLKQFLSDMRVVDYSPFVWQPILRGIILTVRPRRSAKLYARVWTDEGSPLLVYSQRQADGLQARLGDSYRVILGMRYGNPSIIDAFRTLEEENIERIVVLPLYPQFSSTTTLSIYDDVYRAAAGRRCPLFHERKRNAPTLRFIEPYYDDPRYIDAMKQLLHSKLEALPHTPDKFLLTFHGIPKRYVSTGDPYPQQCEVTARLLADAMGWRDEQWGISFQSQFGPEDWLEPSTEDVLTAFHAQGVERPFLFAPGFVTDCLETLDELGNEGREQFEEGGGHGESFYVAPCLNDFPAWMDVMAELVRDNVGGWVRAERQAPTESVKS
jgi:ferrochelatase